MTTYWAIGATPAGDKFRVQFESKREARFWAKENNVHIDRFMECHSNLATHGDGLAGRVLSVQRDQLDLEQA